MEATRTSAFFDFIKEREAIRLRKESGGLHPLTDDHILRDYKFTNVRRHHDRTSRTLIKNFYSKNLFASRKDILLNAAIFRYFGTWEFADAIGWSTYDTFNPEYIKQMAFERLENKERVFTGAYVITNQGISAPKQEVVVDHFIMGLYTAMDRILKVVESTLSWEQTAKAMSNIAGFGGSGFMTKEVLIDTTYTGFWANVETNSCVTEDGNTFSYPVDWWSWTPIGPGARRGAARVSGYTQMESRVVNSAFLSNNATGASQIIDILFAAQDQYWPHDKLSPTDIQFQLCEFDKYERVRLGQGTPRSRYKPYC